METKYGYEDEYNLERGKHTKRKDWRKRYNGRW